ncbi:S41 family peptidase [Paracraurococcus lichenis]|uniref:S41 family peptidase n=1 Tax=Paracraurococcus lichenis TaxID=3064888 RepID=A0ABT9DX01_9PROT|nr:S41 family peptidase [Paracraurococcus sp. LOR1-02]MDO9708428.1 S41 family peptidase [Paracraurococcus sp. LOR1-02]
MLVLLAPALARAQEGLFPREQVQAVLATAMGAVLERHLEAATPAELGLWSMRGLEVLEPAFRTELQSGTLLLSAPDRLLSARPMPALPATGPPHLAALPLSVALSGMFDAAWRASPAIRRAGPERMLRSAFEELFNHLDPYSRYMTPEEAQAARARRIGQSGLGLRLAAGRREEVRIAAVTPGSPAAEAGLRLGDRVLEVDGEPLSARDLAAAAALLEGPAGTEVALRVERGRRRFNVLLLRSTVAPETVHVQRQDEILWLRLDGFSSATDLRLAEALTEAFRPAGPRGVVLDLRGNRGGLLGQAVAVASAFLPDGVVAMTSGRHPDAARTYVAGGPDLARGLPLVVLVDGRTASAAEIVAAALSDRGRGVVVGSATTGKGLIQAVVPLPNGGELLVTWSRVLAPRGWPIQGLGVLPAVCTALGADAATAALGRLRLGEAPMGRALARLRAARAPVPGSEVTALRNTCPPAEGREADRGVARALIEQPEAYLAALAR